AVIKAIKSLKPEIPEILYIIIGNGENLEHLKSLVKLYNLKDNILFLNNIENEILPYFYSLCDIFIMTSKISKNDVEGFGIVYLEAGLFKKPVIATSNGGAKEAVLDKKTGLLINENEEEKLEQYIRKLLLDDIFAKELGENAYTRIKEEFLWKDISKKLIKYIESTD
ncbi:MAG: glycosyltransferase family 4 protein, partial [Patescibacteria group bacterium]|nr:glycosyltransferase family 4 protein [Patescibacteria group bacterium]